MKSDLPYPRELFIEVLQTDMGMSLEAATKLDETLGGISRVH